MAKFKVLLAGCGSMANTWLQYVLKREDCEVLGLCDIIPEKAQKMKEEYITKGLGENCTGLFSAVGFGCSALPT